MGSEMCIRDRGKVALPPQDQLMFIPQRPYLPLGTLRDAVLYPGTREFSDETLKEALELCRIGYLAVHLQEEGDWSHVFSIGEQQRLAFARALLYRPRWLFLDESTSALDEETEGALYRTLEEKLPGTTLVSVGHRSTLLRYHQRVLALDKETHTASLESAEKWEERLRAQ